MLKTLTTILRARTAQETEALEDQNALLILNQHLRDAAQALDGSRRALAITAARDATWRKTLAGLTARIDDLEARAAAALRDGAEDLAGRAAEAIADLETERAAVAADSDKVATEHARLAEIVKAADRRLDALRRGRATAEATEAVRRLRSRGLDRTGGPGALVMAEATLDRLRRTQEEAEAVERSFEDLSPDRSAEAVRRTLEAAGYGGPARPSGAAVLERLRQACLPAPDLGDRERVDRAAIETAP